jgi:hypothetical protein
MVLIISLVAAALLAISALLTLHRDEGGKPDGVNDPRI